MKSKSARERKCIDSFGKHEQYSHHLLQKVTVGKTGRPLGRVADSVVGNKGRERMAEGTCQTRLRISLKYYREFSRVELLRKHACIGVLKPLFSLLCKEQVGNGNNRRWKVLFKKEKKNSLQG